MGLYVILVEIGDVRGWNHCEVPHVIETQFINTIKVLHRVAKERVETKLKPCEC